MIDHTFDMHEFKTNEQFCTTFKLFADYIHEHREKLRNLNFYKTIAKFLINNYNDWPLSPGLLPLVLEYTELRDNFSNYFELFEHLDSLTDPYQMLVRKAVQFFDDAILRESCFGELPQSEYDDILTYVKIVFTNDLFKDVAKQLTAIRHFEMEGEELMYTAREKFVLQRLVCDLKEDFSGHDLYIDLVTIRIQNLKSLQIQGYPQFGWEQINTVEFRHSPEIQRFLDSNEVTYVHSGFFTFEEARSWMNEYAIPHMDDGYSFTAITRLSESGTIEVILQKERHVFEKKRNEYWFVLLGCIKWND